MFDMYGEEICRTCGSTTMVGPLPLIDSQPGSEVTFHFGDGQVKCQYCQAPIAVFKLRGESAREYQKEASRMRNYRAN